MKLPWKRRQPEDLVGGQVAEAQARTDLYPPANHWSNWASPADLASGGILCLPDGVTFPGDLTASGGWCAPSEVIYSMDQAMRASTHPASVVPLMVTLPADGMLSLPELTVKRGGSPFPGRPRTVAPVPEWPAPVPVFKDATAP